VFTKEELAQHDKDADIIWLSIFGRVYDVTKGQQYYGESGGYNFFSGTDASLAYITGT